MSKTLIIKLAGLIGAILTGGSMIFAGDVTTGLGIIAASLTSANFKDA